MDVESCCHTFPSASSSQSVKEHLNTHSKSYLPLAVLTNSAFFQALQKAKGERESPGIISHAYLPAVEWSYNETRSSIVESLIIHCGSFAGEPYHITI